MSSVSKMIERLRRTLKDEDKNSFTDEELVDYISDGISFVRRIVLEHNPEYLSKIIADGYLPKGTNRIDFHSEASYLLSVRVDGKELKRQHFSDIDDLSEEGVPKKYCSLGDKTVLVYPLPEKDCKYTVFGVIKQPAVTANTILPFDNDINSLVAEYAIARAGMSDHFQISQETQLMSVLVSQITTLILRQNRSEGDVVRGYYG